MQIIETGSYSDILYSSASLHDL